MTTRMVRVFVNAAGIEIPEGGTAIDAVRAWDAAAAQSVESGARVITDSRGLPIGRDVPMPAGSILRLVAVRDRAAAATESED